MTREYVALRDKVDAFSEVVHERRSADLACRRGCAACCRVDLTVSDVEAREIRAALLRLDREHRAKIAARRGRSDCVMLEEDGACAVYDARPLVCRTQGHALRYPELPVTWCALNYTNAPPKPEDVLDAERVDVLLALVNRRAQGQPLARTSLASLAESTVDIEGAVPAVLDGLPQAHAARNSR